MASLITLLCSSCFILLSITAAPSLGFTSNPPLGNSIGLHASTLDGKITYTCRNGMWVPVSMAAKLVNAGNEQKPIGSYLRTFANQSQSGTPPYGDDDNAGTWSLINTVGDAAESGHLSSLVAGEIISSLPRSNDSVAYLWDFLSQASLHQFDGTASRVSYIMQKNAVSDEMPTTQCTQNENDTANVAYKAEYMFWKQDMVPPAMMPSQIAVNSNHEQPLEAFFATGRAVYVAASGGKWAFKEAEGRLYDVPGGAELGSFYMNGSLLCLSTAAGASKYASTCAKPIATFAVNNISFPWLLMSITNSTGNLSSLGSLSSIQMVSTFGGVAPSTTPQALDEAQHSAFTSIFWIYTG